MTILSTVDILSVGSAPLFQDERGLLVPLELAEIMPFQPVRMFWITDVPQGGTRGAHAHKACSQVMICCFGRIQIDACDGHRERSLQIGVGEFVNVAPLLLTTEVFLEPHTVLLVLCDRPFEIDDYLDTREELRQYRASIAGR